MDAEARKRLEEASLHVKDCPLAHAPNRLASCACGLGIFAALGHIDRLEAYVRERACSCPGACEQRDETFRDDLCEAHDLLAALSPPTGEEQ